MSRQRTLIASVGNLAFSVVSILAMIVAPSRIDRVGKLSMSAQAKLECDRGRILLDGGRVGILLIHGLGGTPVELNFVAQALNRAGHTVYCPLLDGHGGPGERLNATTWMDWYKSVAQAHDVLKERSEVIIVGGLSAGVLLALHLACLLYTSPSPRDS